MKLVSLLVLVGIVASVAAAPAPVPVPAAEPVPEPVPEPQPTGYAPQHAGVPDPDRDDRDTLVAGRPNDEVPPELVYWWKILQSLNRVKVGQNDKRDAQMPQVPPKLIWPDWAPKVWPEWIPIWEEWNRTNFRLKNYGKRDEDIVTMHDRGLVRLIKKYLETISSDPEKYGLIPKPHDKRQEMGSELIDPVILSALQILAESGVDLPNLDAVDSLQSRQE